MRESRELNKQVKKRRWPKILLSIVIVFVLLIVAFWIKFGGQIKASIADGYSYSQRLDAQDFYPKNSTVIYGADNKELKRFSQSDADYTKEQKNQSNDQKRVSRCRR